MSQFDFGVIDPYVVDGVELADDLNRWRDALYTHHRGSVRPSYAQPGMMWLDDTAGATAWFAKFYTGPTIGDVSMFQFNTTTGDRALVGGMQAATPSDAATNNGLVATTAFVQAAIAAALASGALWPVGSVIDLVGSLAAAPSGWVLAREGTIGSAASGATLRANADCSALYTHLWNGLANTEAPVTGGRGANAPADFAANKPIGGLDFRGAVRATFDSLGGNAAGRLPGFTRVGLIAGAPTVAITEAEMAYHSHSVYDPSHGHTLPIADLGLGGNGGGNVPQHQDNTLQAFASGTGVQVNFEGGNAAHNNVQPTRTVTTLIKL